MDYLIVWLLLIGKLTMHEQSKDLCKLRTITVFSVLDKNRKAWKEEIVKASDFCLKLSKKFITEGYAVQSIRIVTNAFGEYINTQNIDTAKAVLDSTIIKHIGFGRGFVYHNYYTRNWHFKIRNIQIEKDLPEAPLVKGSQPAGTHMKTLVQQQKPVKVLLLGDSITARGEDRSYAFFMSKDLEQRYTNQ